MNTEEASSAANNKTQGVDPPLNVVNNEILSTDGLTTIANNEIPGVEGLATSGQGDIPLSGHEAAPGTGSWLSFFFKFFFFNQCAANRAGSPQGDSHIDSCVQFQVNDSQ